MKKGRMGAKNVLRSNTSWSHFKLLSFCQPTCVQISALPDDGHSRLPVPRMVFDAGAMDGPAPGLTKHICVERSPTVWHESVKAMGTPQGKQWSCHPVSGGGGSPIPGRLLVLGQHVFLIWA